MMEEIGEMMSTMRENAFRTMPDEQLRTLLADIKAEEQRRLVESENGAYIVEGDYRYKPALGFKHPELEKRGEFGWELLSEEETDFYVLMAKVWRFKHPDETKVGLSRLAAKVAETQDAPPA